jgi:hypothetical protein
MSQPLTIIIVEKGGSLKTLAVKDYKVEELYKKCGFKKAEGFDLQVEWPVKIDTKRYIIQMYGKTDGKANSENKYDFPPPVDNKLYFGSCALIGMVKDEANNATMPINLTVELWEKMYEKLFGGFENLALTCNDDEDEEDELQNVPKNRKTKRGGYLKDGFVVDSSDTEEVSGFDSCEEENSEEPTENSGEAEEDEEEFVLDDTKSELSEESYIEEDNQG